MEVAIFFIVWGLLGWFGCAYLVIEDGGALEPVDGLVCLIGALAGPLILVSVLLTKVANKLFRR